MLCWKTSLSCFLGEHTLGACSSKGKAACSQMMMGFDGLNFKGERETERRDLPRVHMRVIDGCQISS